jgi:hypothetical protein
MSYPHFAHFIGCLFVNFGFRARAQGDLLMLMGTAEAVAEGPSKPVLFEEDLTDAQKSRLSDSGTLSRYQSV